MAVAQKDKLSTYRAKRDFAQTPEPSGGADAKGTGKSFVVQKHAARRLHYDFRLELDGVLKSWAITKGPSTDTRQRRLAVRTEDHPIDYGTFEGTIPKGAYGGGTVMLWDRGTWDPVGDPHEGLEDGRLKFVLHGERMRGRWTLVRMKAKPGEKRENWLLIKERDDEADTERDLTELFTQSVATGRAINEIAEGAAAKDAPLTEPQAKRRRANPRFVAPQLAALVDAPPSGSGWVHELKLDGYRLQCALGRGGATLFTRGGKDWTERFPEIARALEGLATDGTLIDGELVAFGDGGATSFQRLQAALSGETNGLAYVAFDLLRLDCEDLRALPLTARKAKLETLLAPLGRDRIRYSEHLESDGPAMLAEACRLGAEGIISKQADAPYRSGRSRFWLKAKCTRRQEFVIGGTMPSSVHGRPFASLLVGHYSGGQLTYAGRVGTGFDRHSFEELERRFRPLVRKTSPFAQVPSEVKNAVWLSPKLVAEVNFQEWTDDGLLRHASFQGLRKDKPPRKIVREVPKTVAESVQKTEAGKVKRSGKAKADETVTVAGVTLSNADRILYPSQGVTKADLARYYESVADWMVPLVERRPLTLVRCPQGREKACFYQRHLDRALPDALRSIDVEEKTETRSYAYLQDVAGLVALTQMGVLEIHPWGATIDDLDRPDLLIFDLDPGDGVSFAQVSEAARELKGLLEAVELTPFLKLTGGKGLHLVVPLEPADDWETVKSFSKSLSQALERAAPERYVAVSTKAKRKGRIYVDYLRNGRGATAIAPYASRAREGAPVACPISWQELSRIEDPAQFTVMNVPARLKRLKRDPWGSFEESRARIHSGAAEELLRLASA